MSKKLVVICIIVGSCEWGNKLHNRQAYSCRSVALMDKNGRSQRQAGDPEIEITLSERHILGLLRLHRCERASVSSAAIRKGRSKLLAFAVGVV